MGIPNFTKLIKPYFEPSKTPEPYDSILIDAQSFLYEAIHKNMEPAVDSKKFVDVICRTVVRDLSRTIDLILKHDRPEHVVVVVSFDGEGVPMKWPTQRNRRSGKACSGKTVYRFALFGNNTISRRVQSSIVENFASRYEWADVRIVVTGCNVAGEGEHKLFDVAEKTDECRRPIVVSVDHDVFLISILRRDRYDDIQIYRYGEFFYLSKFIETVLPYPVERLVVASFLFGNDFVPPLLEISNDNAGDIHQTLLTLSSATHHPAELTREFLSKMQSRMRFDETPHVDERLVVRFWLTYLWIEDYYRFPRFPQKYIPNEIYDAFDRNAIITALLDEAYSKETYAKAKTLYENLTSFESDSDVGFRTVFDDDLRQRLKSFWVIDANENGLCYDIKVKRKTRGRDIKRST